MTRLNATTTAGQPTGASIDANGDLAINSAAPANLDAVETIGSLKAITGMADGTKRLVMGYYAAGDGGGNTFRYDQSLTAKSFTATASDDRLKVARTGKNLLTPAQSSIEVSPVQDQFLTLSAPFFTYQCSAIRSTSQSQVGSASLAVSTSVAQSTAGGSFVFVNGIELYPSTTYTLSVYVYAPVSTYLVAQSIYLQGTSSILNTIATYPASLTALSSGWTRLTATGTTPSDWHTQDQVVLQPARKSDNSAYDPTVTLYYDGLQVEQGSSATSWELGSGGHPFKERQKIRVYGSSLPTGATAGTDYYAVSVTRNTCKLASTYANAVTDPPTAINLTADGSGTVNYGDDGGLHIVPSANSPDGRWVPVPNDKPMSVKQFGAKVDAVTDDSSAIQTAWDNLGVVYHPPGYARVNTMLRARQGLSVRGSGWQSGLLGPGNSNPIVFVEPDPVTAEVHNFGMENMTIDGGDASQGATGVWSTGYNFGRNYGAGRNIYFKDCLFTNCGVGYHSIFDQALVMNNCKFTYNGIGLYLTDDAELGSYTGCDFRWNAVGTKLEAKGDLIGFSAGDIYGHHFSRCHWESNTAQGVIIDGGHKNTFETCKWEANTGTYVEIKNTHAVRPDLNTFINCMWSGTIATPTVKQLDIQDGWNNFILGGWFFAASTSGIFIASSAIYTKFINAEYDSSLLHDSGGQTYILGNSYGFVGSTPTSITSAQTVANTSTETVLGSMALSNANELAAGTVLRITADGVASTTGTPTMTFRIRIGTTVLAGNIAASWAPTAGATMTNQPWRLDALVTVRSAGSSGTIIGTGSLLNNFTTTTVQLTGGTAGTVAVNTTVAGFLGLTFTWGTASSSNTLTCHNLLLQIVKP